MLYTTIDSNLKNRSQTWTDFLITTGLPLNFLRRSLENDVEDEELNIISSYFDIPKSKLLKNTENETEVKKSIDLKKHLRFVADIDSLVINLQSLTKSNELFWTSIDINTALLQSLNNTVIEGVELTATTSYVNNPAKIELRESYISIFKGSYIVIVLSQSNFINLHIIREDCVITYSLKQKELKLLLSIIQIQNGVLT